MPIANQHRLRIGRFSEPGRPYLITIACHQRRKVFDSFRAGRCFAKAVAALQDDATTWCWVAMPDHVHWLMAPGENLDISRCVQKLKALTTRGLGAANLTQSPVWQKGFHDRALRHEERLKTMARYIIANPVRAGIVDSVRDWPSWDAAWI